MNPCPVGTHRKSDSPFGLADMSGNLWEWTASPYAPSYTAQPVGDAFVIRGGSFASSAEGMANLDETFRADRREALSAKRSVDYVGFRCAR